VIESLASAGMMGDRVYIAILTAIGLASVLAGCRTLDESASARIASAEIRRPNGAGAGSASVYRNGEEVTISVALQGFEPGALTLRLERAVNCHEVAASARAQAELPLDAKRDASGLRDFDVELPSVPIGQTRSGTASAAISGISENILAHLFRADGFAVMLYDPAPSQVTQIPPPLACGILERR